MPDLESIKFPIGCYALRPFSEMEWQDRVYSIAQFPLRLEATIQVLDEAQLQTPYREGGWTVHQLVHHLCDSHLNAYCRIKLALTEETPVIKPYEQEEWVKTADLMLPVNNATTLLYALHQRITKLIREATPATLQRKFIHPEYKEPQTLWELIGYYAWHGNHHLAQINALRQRMKW